VKNFLVPWSRTIQTSFQSATSTCRGMRAGVPRVDSSPLRCLYVNNMSTHSRHVELAQYAEDTVLVATSRSPSFIAGYLEAYLCRLEHWLRDWRIAINISKSAAVLFVKTMRGTQKPRAVRFSENRYSGLKQRGTLGWTLTHSLPGRRKSARWERRQLKDWAYLVPC
jgi:hypothetical protein